MQVLSQVLDKMKSGGQGLIPCHALLLVRNKLLALYSSRSAQELSASDILLLNLLVQEQTEEAAVVPGQPSLQECDVEGVEESGVDEEVLNTLQNITLEQLEGEEQLLSGEGIGARC